MSSVTQAAATLDDLYRVEGKAELIAGRIRAAHGDRSEAKPGRFPHRPKSRRLRPGDRPRGSVHGQYGFRGALRSPRVGSRSRRTRPRPPRTSSARSRRTTCDFSTGLRSSRSRSGARTTTVTRPKRPWRPSGPTTSRRARSSSGTLTPSTIGCFKYRFRHAPDQPEVFIRGQVADAEPAVPRLDDAGRHDLRLTEPSRSRAAAVSLTIPDVGAGRRPVRILRCRWRRRPSRRRDDDGRRR